MPAEQLSGTIVVIIIAVGVQGCIMLFVFAKRQIMRFAIRNRRGPHAVVGQGAPKWLRRDTDRLLDCIPFIRHEPKVEAASLSRENTEHYFRSKALEEYASFERLLCDYSLNYARSPGTGVRSFLLRCLNGPLCGVDAAELHAMCDAYEHARHGYQAFGEQQLRAFTSRLNSLGSRVAANKSLKPHPSPMPLRSASSSSAAAANGDGGGGGKRRIVGFANAVGNSGGAAAPAAVVVSSRGAGGRNTAAV